MIPLRKKSWHSTVYKLTYGYKADFPTNLCPYFWQLLFALVLSLTVGLLLLPFYLGDRLFKGKDYKEGYFRNANIGKAIVIYLFVGELFTMIAIFFIGFNFDNPIVGFGVMGWIVALIAGIIIFKKWLDDNKKPVQYHYKPPKEKKPSILVEFIKAKYNRYCPKITWRD